MKSEPWSQVAPVTWHAVVAANSGERPVPLHGALTLFDARVAARDRDLAPVAFEWLVDGHKFGRVAASKEG